MNQAILIFDVIRRNFQWNNVHDLTNVIARKYRNHFLNLISRDMQVLQRLFH